MIMYDLSNFLYSNDYALHLEGEIKSRPLPKESNIKIIDPIKYVGDIFKVDGEYDLGVNITYSIDSNCDRCLLPTTEKIETVLSEKMIVDKGNYNDEENEESEEDYIYLENNSFDLEDYIWNQVITSLPMKILCNNECKGLCPQCGVDLNTQSCDCEENTIDPRLEKLKELFPEE